MTIQFSPSELTGDLRVSHTADGNLRIEHDVSEEDPAVGPGAAESRRPETDPNPEIGDDIGGLFDDIVSVVKKVGKVVTKPITVAAKATAKVTVDVVEATHVDRFARNAVRTAGHAAHSLSKATDAVTGVVKDAASAIPVVGPGFRAVIEAAEEPFKFASAIASGKRIDQALLKTLKNTVENVKDVAPYVQAVVSFVPGIGTGLSAGIAAGTALADGRPIDEALLAATRAAIPGGPIAKATFEAGLSAARGESVDEAVLNAAISAVPGSDQTRAQLRGAVDIAQAAAAGKPLSDLALRAAVSSLGSAARTQAESWIGKPGAQSKIYDQLTKALPSEARKALTTGIALGAAKADQDDLHRAVASPTASDKITAVGETAIAKSAMLRATASKIPDKKAFALGVGLMKHSSVPSLAMLILRNQLPKGRQRLSFDAGVTAHVGAVTSKQLPKKMSPAAKAGYYSVVGALAGSPKQRASMVRVLSKNNPAAQTGAALAIKDVRKARTAWRRLVTWIKNMVK